MRKGPVRIPDDAFDRTVEYLDGAPGLAEVKSRAHAYLRLYNLFSHLYQAHHFDSVGEFLVYQKRLWVGGSRVAFKEVSVTERNRGDNKLEFMVSDGTGHAVLVYNYRPRVTQGQGMLPDAINSPVEGAREGDRLQIFTSIYRGRGRVSVPEGFYVKNDGHYRRMRETRDSLSSRPQRR